MQNQHILDIQIVNYIGRMTDAMTSGACMKNSSLDYSSINACKRIGSAFSVIGYFSKNVYEIKNVRRNTVALSLI